MFPSHSAVHDPLPPAMRGRPSCSLPEGQPKPASQASPQLRSSRITLHRHVCLHMLILWLDIVCQAKEARAANQAGPGGAPSSSCICMVSAQDWGSLSLDARPADRVGERRTGTETLKLDGPVHQRAHFGDACWMLTGPLPRGTSTTNAKMTASVVGYHAPGMGDGATERPGRGTSGSPISEQNLGALTQRALMTTDAGLQWRTVSPGSVHTDATFLLGTTDIAPHSINDEKGRSSSSSSRHPPVVCTKMEDLKMEDLNLEHSHGRRADADSRQKPSEAFFLQGPPAIRATRLIHLGDGYQNNRV